MMYIKSISTISPISALMVGCTGHLRTSPCYLHLCMCKHVFPCADFPGRILDILRRFYLDVSPIWLSALLLVSQSCLTICLAIIAQKYQISDAR